MQLCDLEVIETQCIQLLRLKEIEVVVVQIRVAPMHKVPNAGLLKHQIAFGTVYLQATFVQRYKQVVLVIVGVSFQMDVVNLTVVDGDGRCFDQFLRLGK